MIPWWMMFEKQPKIIRNSPTKLDITFTSLKCVVDLYWASLAGLRMDDENKDSGGATPAANSYWPR